MSQALKLSLVAAAVLMSMLMLPGLSGASTTTMHEGSYPATLSLSVDATDVGRRILVVHEVMPTAPGKQAFYFPEWLPGTHSTSFSSVKSLAGLRFSNGSNALVWTRDTIDMGKFYVEVPQGVKEIAIDFQFLTPSTGTGDSSRVSMSHDMIALEWHSTLLYPAGYAVAKIPVDTQVKLPAGWQFASALEVASQQGDTVTFKTTDVGELVDSPLLAGRYFKKIDLNAAGTTRVTLDVAADHASDLPVQQEQIDAFRALVEQARKLYGSEHYGHYDFLLNVSDTIGGIGLEHHQSSEDGVEADYFTNWSGYWGERDLLPHEYTHSWNGKFRRPADLATSDFNMPMQDTLLWMYEGQTQFWGEILTARAGLSTLEQAREKLASVAAAYDAEPGRAWRNLQDTTNEEILTTHNPGQWGGWQRGADYYDEMELVWLDADTKIMELTGGARSLDDFARGFFSMHDGSHAVMTYQFGDVVAALNAVAPYDWAGFLRTRLDSHGPGAPLDGITRSGWQLIYTDTPNAYREAVEKLDENGESFTLSIGLRLNHDNKITDVRWQGPAFQAGLAPGGKVVAINGSAIKKGLIGTAILAAKTDPSAPIDLLILENDVYRTVKLNYHDGPRFPHLVRIDAQADVLTKIFSPRP